MRWDGQTMTAEVRFDEMQIFEKNRIFHRIKTRTPQPPGTGNHMLPDPLDFPTGKSRFTRPY
jgi:hypothetical protein